MKGKHGASAEARHKIEALEAEVAKLRHSLSRVEAERDDATATLRQREIAHADQLRLLAADRDAATSPRVRELEDLIAQWRARFEEEGKRSVKALRQSDDAFLWIARHMRSEHGWNESTHDLVGRVERDLRGVHGLEYAARVMAEVPRIERDHPEFNGRWLQVDVQ